MPWAQGMSVTYPLCRACSGYLPPEFILHRIISNKLDIFSLGVVVIKIIAGPGGYTRSAEMTSEQFTKIVRIAITN